MADTQRPGRLGLADELAARAASITVGDLLVRQALAGPDRIAVEDGTRRLTYAEFNERVNRSAHALAALGVRRGDRIGILSENRAEYVELLGAAAKLGAILATLNWRLRPRELEGVIGVSTPSVIVVSDRYHETLAGIRHDARHVLRLGDDWEERLARASADEPPAAAEPEDGLIIIYTSGTTGLPKGALISHRAAIARVQLQAALYGQTRDDTAVCWTPMFHVASTDPMLGALWQGGKVLSIDGFQLDPLLRAIETERIWWLALIPGMLDQVIEAMRSRGIRPRGIKLCGAQADLLPPHQIAEVSGLLEAPFWNTFGMTEAGIPVASYSWFAPGTKPERLSKTVDPLCCYRLVDADDNDVGVGERGEFCFRGPTLFSGYWNEAEANERDFRGGYFHTGDVFRRNADGTIDFVDRVKYMIKSGGENIYPAEIEQVLLAEQRVDAAVVVRRRDDRWGEVPVAFVARNDDSLTADDLMALCRAQLAGYKRPKEIRFVALAHFPRSTAGKIQRFVVETWLAAPDAAERS